MDKSETLLPWYINETLDESESQTVVEWFQREKSSSDSYLFTQQVSQVVHAQEFETPSHLIRSRLLQSIQDQPTRSSGKLQPWVWGIPLMLLLFILLWNFVHPGTQLQWTTNTSSDATFRIYRAPLGTTDFILVNEFIANPAMQTYEYKDISVLPGRNYQYILEIQNADGSNTYGRSVVANSQMTLVAQISIILTSFVLTFGMIMIVQEMKSPPRLDYSSS